MTFKECRGLIDKDKGRFRVDKTGYKVSVPFTSLFRFGSYLMSKDNIIARLSLVLFVKPLYMIMSLLTGIQLPLGTVVGGGIRFPHFSCIVIAKSCIVGTNCTIHQGVTIGQSHFGKHQGYPVIGDNVLIYAGAKVCGNIHVGKNVVIGANAVITTDIPDYCVVVGHNIVVSEDSYIFLGEKGRKIYW